MSADCCTNTYDLGCSPCGTSAITLPIAAPVSGIYTALFKYRGTLVSFTFDGVMGEALVVPVAGLNENFTHYFYILDPNGDRLPFGLYDCFSLRLIPRRIGQPPPPSAPPGDCDDATYTLRNTVGTDLSSGNIASGASAIITAPAGQAQLRDTDNVPISTASVPSGAAISQTAPDAVAELQNAVGVVLSSTNIRSGQTAVIVAPSATYQLKDSAGGNLGGVGTIHSNGHLQITAPDGSVQLQDNLGNDIGGLVPVRSGQAGLVIPVSGLPCASLCTLLGAVAAENVETQILGCVTTEATYAIEDALIQDLDAEAYIARVQQADGEALEGPIRDAIRAFVIGLKADGIWSSIGHAAILAGARTVAGALVPLKGSSPTNVNFVSGDYNRETGLKGNASTKYLDTNRNNNVAGQNDSHSLVCVSEQDSTLTSTAYMGAGVADSGSNLLGRSGTAPYNAVVRSRTSTAFTASTSGIGCLGTSRSGSANYTLRIAGVDQTVTQASQTPHSANVFVFARNAAGAPSILSNGRLTFYSMGASLDLALLDARVTTLIAAINTAL